MPHGNRFAINARRGGGGDHALASVRVGVRAVATNNLNTKQIAKQTEHSRDHAINWKPRTQRFIIKAVHFLAHFLGEISKFPRVHGASGIANFLGAEIFQLRNFLVKLWTNALSNVLHKFQRGLSSARHATRRGDIGEMFLAQQARLLIAQRKNFTNQRGVVPRAFQTNFSKTFPTQLTKIRVVGVLQNRHDRRRLQREAPRIRAILAGGGLLGGGKRTCRQTRELFFILYEMFPRVGGIKNVL